MSRFGIAVGDAVFMQKQLRGIVTGPGSSPWTVTVKFAALGNRIVQLDQLHPVKFTEVTRDKDGQKMSKESLAVSWAKVDASAELEPEKATRNLKKGDYVKAKTGPWADMGVGHLKKIGGKPGTADVRFNMLGESWTMNCDDLEKVVDAGCCSFSYSVRTDFQHKHVSDH